MFEPFVVGFVFVFVCRMLLKLFVRNPKSFVGRAERNIGMADRVFRAVLGIVLFAWAVLTRGNSVLMFWSGFCIFEAVFSWCGFYAAIGKNSCPWE